MPFAILVDGQPVEISADREFVTTQLKVQADEAEHYGVEPGAVIEQLIQHPAGSLSAMTPEERDRLCIQQFTEASAPPSGKEIATRSLVLGEGGAISVAVTYQNLPPLPVPEKISRAQARIILSRKPSQYTGMTMLQAVDDYVTNHGDVETKIWWTDGSEFHRDNDLLLQVAALLPLTSDQLDDLFREGADIR